MNKNKNMDLMKNLITITCLIVVTTTGYSQSGPNFKSLAKHNEAFSKTNNAVSDLDVLLKTDQACSEAANKSQMERLWDCWHEDAMMLLSTEKTVKGIAEIKEFTTASRKDPNFSITWSVKGGQLSPDGMLGYTHGVGTITRSDNNGNAMSQTNPYLCVWKKDLQGQWKLIIEK